MVLDKENIVDKYLRAMSQRNVDVISSVLTDASTVVMMNGAVYRGISAILDMHKEWFQDTEWSIAYKVDSLFEAEDLCHALVRIEYSDRNDAGEPYEIQYYLFLLFGTKNGQWVLAHDQNTLIRG